MATLSNKSLDHLDTCDVRLQMILREAIKTIDFTVLCGHRNQADQEAAFAAGTTKAHWPDSKHNSYPSKAVDIAPYPIDWKDLKRFQELMELVEKIANDQGTKVRFGRDFSTLHDWPHVELA